VALEAFQEYLKKEEGGGSLAMGRSWLSLGIVGGRVQSF